jgi:hypothetical protein
VLLRNRSNKPNWLLALGMLCVSTAGAWRALTAHLGPVADGVDGFLYGVGLGILVFAVWRKRQCRLTD